MRVLYIPVNLPVRMGETVLRSYTREGYAVSHIGRWGPHSIRVELERVSNEVASFAC